MSFNLDTYLNRIGFKDEISTKIEILNKLQFLHSTTIAFENLNPLLKLPVDIDIDSIQDKIVKNFRGGYCYEQNTLFYYVLKTIGFDVKPLAARVIWNQPKEAVTTLTHMFLLVTIENTEYLVDVGFGAQTPTIPLKISKDEEQLTSHETYRIRKFEEGFILETKEHNDWKSMYKFNKSIQEFIDFEVGNWYTSTHPDFIFTKILFVAKAHQNGRHTLTNNKFRTTYQDGEEDNKIIQSVEEFKHILINTFDLNINKLKDLDKKLESLI